MYGTLTVYKDSHGFFKQLRFQDQVDMAQPDNKAKLIFEMKDYRPDSEYHQEKAMGLAKDHGIPAADIKKLFGQH